MKKTTASQCRYALITCTLQRAIELGQYAVGTALPPEAELCKQFDVSRHTVREALRNLRNQGLVISRQGSGTIVTAAKPARHFVQAMESIDDLHEFLRQAKPKIISKKIDTLPDKLAKFCGFSNNQQMWLHIQLIRLWGKPLQPTMLSDLYIDAKYSEMEESFDGKQSLVELFQKNYGVFLSCVQQDIQPIVLNQKQSTLLKCKKGSPALEAIRRCSAENGDLLVISSNISPAGRFVYSTCMKVAH